MGFLGTLFGSGKALGQISNTVDRFVFTNEEKSETLLKFLAAYEPFRLAQRILAIMFTTVFLVEMLASFGVYMYGVITGNVTMANAGKEMTATVWQSLGTPEAMIVGFYFAGGVMNGVVREYKRNSKKLNNDKR